MRYRNLNAFARAYLECALWTATDDNGTPLDRSADVTDFTPGSVLLAWAVCSDFEEKNAALLNAAYENPDVRYDASNAGHDLWLTRNRHGAGFWSRELGEIGQRLTSAAHALGESQVIAENDDEDEVYLYFYEA